MERNLLSAIKKLIGYGIIVSSLISAYDGIVNQFVPASNRDKYILSAFGWSWQTWAVIALLGLVVYLIIGNLIENRKEKPLESKKEIHGDGHIAETVTDSPVVKASDGGYAVGRDLIINPPAQEQSSDDNLQLRIKIHSNEYNRVVGRILHLTIYNVSLGNIEGCEVILNDVKKDDMNHWSFHYQGSAFNWSDSTHGRKIVNTGDYAEADMLKTDYQSPHNIRFQVPVHARDLPPGGGVDHYYMDITVCCIYNRKRYEFPISYRFHYLEKNQFSDIEFVNPKDFPSQIISASIEYDNEVLYDKR